MNSLTVKRFIVAAMETVCGWLDWIPTWERGDDGRLVRCQGTFGCGLTKLAYRAAQIEQRWGLKPGGRRGGAKAATR